MATEYKWEQKTLGQNKKIQEVVASAAKASELLNANMALAKGGIKAAQLFLTTVMNPKVIILNTIADAIDGFVESRLFLSMPDPCTVRVEVYGINRTVDGLSCNQSGVRELNRHQAFPRWDRRKPGSSDCRCPGSGQTHGC